jgi:hypothetical protein
MLLVIGVPRYPGRIDTVLCIEDAARPHAGGNRVGSHAESTWPRSRQVLEAILEGVPEAERQKIAGANAARVYHLA